MKKGPKKADKFSLTEVGALIDQLRSEFKVFGEGLAGLGDKVDSIMGMVAKNREDITSLNFRVIGIKDDITKINGKLARIEENTRSIKDNLKSKVDRKDFELLEKKVASLGS